MGYPLTRPAKSFSMLNFPSQNMTAKKLKIERLIPAMNPAGDKTGKNPFFREKSGGFFKFNSVKY